MREEINTNYSNLKKQMVKNICIYLTKSSYLLGGKDKFRILAKSRIYVV